MTARQFTLQYLRARFVAGAVVALVSLTASTAQAHPHVWVTVTTSVLFAPDGMLTGVRHDWTFDDMYSAFATTGIGGQGKDGFTREQLQPLAKVNVDSLKDYDFFTYARIDGKRQPKDIFGDPVDYWLDYDAATAALTLHFTLPLRTPVAAKQLAIEVYDPEFFIDFGFAEDDPVRLVGAPAGCSISSSKPRDDNFLSVQKLNRSFIPPEANVGMGMQFANKIAVSCR